MPVAAWEVRAWPWGVTSGRREEPAPVGPVGSSWARRPLQKGTRMHSTAIASSLHARTTHVQFVGAMYSTCTTQFYMHMCYMQVKFVHMWHTCVLYAHIVYTCILCVHILHTRVVCVYALRVLLAFTLHTRLYTPHRHMPFLCTHATNTCGLHAHVLRTLALAVCTKRRPSSTPSSLVPGVQRPGATQAAALGPQRARGQQQRPGGEAAPPLPPPTGPCPPTARSPQPGGRAPAVRAHVGAGPWGWRVLTRGLDSSSTGTRAGRSLSGCPGPWREVGSVPHHCPLARGRQPPSPRPRHRPVAPGREVAQREPLSSPQRRWWS